MKKVTKTAGSIAAIGAMALGGAAIGNAASSGSGSSSSGTTTQQPAAAAPPSGGAPLGYGAAQGPPMGPNGRHVGANGKEEQALSSDVSKKVAAAALAKVKGTLERTETDVDHGSPYEAHIRKSDGTEYEVLVNSNFEVTAVNQMGHP